MAQAWQEAKYWEVSIAKIAWEGASTALPPHLPRLPLLHHLRYQQYLFFIAVPKVWLSTIVTINCCCFSVQFDF